MNQEKLPSTAFLRAIDKDPYSFPEQKDNRHTCPKRLGGKIGAALAVGYAMIQDDENLTDIKEERVFVWA